MGGWNYVDRPQTRRQGTFRQRSHIGYTWFEHALGLASRPRLAAERRRVALREFLTDLYARALLILEVFGAQFVRLTPLWLAGVWLGATLAWLLAPWVARQRLSPPRERHRRDRPARGLLAGGALGLVSPFALLSLIGLLRELGREPRLRPWVVGFALASPLLDPTMFAFTLLALGPRLAGLRVVVALLAVYVAGAVILRRSPPAAAVGATIDQAVPSLPERTALGYARHLARHLAFSGRHYLLALLLTAWLQVLLPLRAWLSVGNPGGAAEVLLAALLGVPLYICGGGAIALADGLLHSGLSQGAALAYLTVGAVTTPRALTGLLALVDRRGSMVFIVAVVAIAILGGYILNALA